MYSFNYSGINLMLPDVRVESVKTMINRTQQADALSSFIAMYVPNNTPVHGMVRAFSQTSTAGIRS